LGYEDAVERIAQQGKQPQYNSESSEITRYFRLRVRSRFFDLSGRYARILSLKGKKMPTDERITKAVFAAVDELNEQLPAGVHVEKSLDAPLYGTSGKLESLDFVTLIMEVEEKLNAEFGTDITIADEDLLSKEKSPFSSLGTLIEYLQDLLKEANA
jgi:acyl carrier protein